MSLEQLDSMPHVAQSTQEALDKAKASTASEAEAADEKSADDPKTAEEYTFKFSWRDARGRPFDGTFTNSILTHQDRQTIGNLQALWQGGQPYSAFDGLTSEINFIMAHMSVSLKPGAGADWAKDLRMLKSVELLQALFAEVASHEATFHGRTPDQEGGQKVD